MDRKETIQHTFWLLHDKNQKNQHIIVFLLRSPVVFCLLDYSKPHQFNLISGSYSSEFSGWGTMNKINRHQGHY